MFILTHPVDFPCGRKPEGPEKTHDFRQSCVDRLFSHEPIARIELTFSQVKRACSDDRATEAPIISPRYAEYASSNPARVNSYCLRGKSIWLATYTPLRTYQFCTYTVQIQWRDASNCVSVWPEPTSGDFNKNDLMPGTKKIQDGGYKC